MTTAPSSPPSLPRISRGLKKTSLFILRLLGWRVSGTIPDLPKAVILVAPHTSNCDFVYMLLGLWATGLKAQWMAKKSLFRGVAGPIMRWLGGIPIDRNKAHNVVPEMVSAFNNHDQLLIGILPEGTRSKQDYWKSGFYYIAQAAKVPVLLSSIDYERKLGRLGPVLWLSGDMEADMSQIREFYTGVKGKHPERFSDIRLKPRRRGSNEAG